MLKGWILFAIGCADCVTWFTEAHQVALCVLVLGEHHELENMVNVFSESYDSLGETIHAEGMTLQVA